MTIDDNIYDYDNSSPVRGNIDVLPQTRRDYIMSHYPQVDCKKYSFLTVLVMGLAAIGVGFIVSCTIMIIYGINTIGNEPEEFVSLMEDAIRRVPVLRKSFSPVFSDILDDQRQPDYRDQLEVTAQMQSPQNADGKLRTIVTVVNNGTETVSLLPLRVAILDAKGKIVAQTKEFVATPLAAQPYWRGPLKPGSTRHINSVISGTSSATFTDNLTIEVEVADIRIWDGAGQVWPYDSLVCKGIK